MGMLRAQPGCPAPQQFSMRDRIVGQDPCIGPGGSKHRRGLPTGLGMVAARAVQDRG
jgi:hypothetical protein